MSASEAVPNQAIGGLRFANPPLDALACLNPEMP
jgi:hypothetical protein